MRKFKLLLCCILLVTTPLLLAVPQNDFPPTPYRIAQQEDQEWIQPTTYDEILQMLEELETGRLERMCSPHQLERINHYLAVLSKEGILPGEFDEEVALNQDICDLINGDDSAYQLISYLQDSGDYTIIPAVLYDTFEYNAV